MDSLSIVLFGYNESKTIYKVFKKTLINIKKITSDFEIIIIDDGSSDNSSQIINEITSKYPFVNSIFNNYNLGIGQTLLKGYKNTISAGGTVNALKNLIINSSHINKKSPSMILFSNFKLALFKWIIFYVFISETAYW